MSGPDTLQKRGKKTKISIRECLTEAILGWNCFGRYNEDKKFYTSNDKYVRHFIRRSIYDGRVCALQKLFISSHYDSITAKITSHFNCQEKDAIPVYLEYNKNETEKLTKEIDNSLNDYRDNT